MQRPKTTVLIEAFVIGAINMIIFLILKTLKLKLPIYTLLFISGALIHLIFEYTGGNKWWCRQTYKLHY